MQTSSFRKLDVDSDGPDDFEEDEDKDVTALVSSASIREYVDSNRIEEALQSAISSFSLIKRNQKEKNELIQTITSIFQALKHSEIEKLVENLKIEEADILMAYVFKSMEISSESHPNLLFCHARIFEKFGYGCIVRVFTARLF